MINNRKSAFSGSHPLAPKVMGWFQRGAGNAGMFFPGRIPTEGDSPWLPPQIQESCQLYVQSGVLVRPVVSEDLYTKGQSFIQTVPPAILRERITQVCQLYLESDKDGETEIQTVLPPKWLVEAIQQRTA